MEEANNSKLEILDSILLIQKQQSLFWDNIRLAVLLASQEVTDARINYIESTQGKPESKIPFVFEVIIDSAFLVIPFGTLASKAIKYGVVRTDLLKKSLANFPKGLIKFEDGKKWLKELIKPDINEIGHKKIAKIIKESNKTAEQLSPILGAAFGSISRSHLKNQLRNNLPRKKQGLKIGSPNLMDSAVTVILESYLTHVNTSVYYEDIAFERLKEFVRYSTEEFSDVIEILNDYERSLLKKRQDLLRAASSNNRPKEFSESFKDFQRYIEACIWALNYDFDELELGEKRPFPGDTIEKKGITTLFMSHPLPRDYRPPVEAFKNAEQWEYLGSRLLLPEDYLKKDTIGEDNALKKIRNQPLSSSSFLEVLSRDNKRYRLKLEVKWYLKALRRYLLELNQTRSKEQQLDN